MTYIGEHVNAVGAAGDPGRGRPACASWLPDASIFDNLFVRVSAEVGRHSCEKGK
jgi:hypothetical protein